MANSRHHKPPAFHARILGSSINPSNPVYNNKKPFKSYENKIEEYYQKRDKKRYKYSDISNEARIITNELMHYQKPQITTHTLLQKR